MNTNIFISVCQVLSVRLELTSLTAEVFETSMYTIPSQERRAGKENRTPRTTLEVLGITTIRYPHGRGGIRTPEKPLCKSGALGHYATRP